MDLYIGKFQTLKAYRLIYLNIYRFKDLLIHRLADLRIDGL